MAFFTPRGLKIRLRTDEAFTYISRLYPKINAFQVLKTVEGIELVPGVFGSLTGLYLFFNDYNHQEIAIYVGIVTLFAGLLAAFGITLISVIVRTITRLAYIPFGYEIHTVGLIVIGLLTVGWQGMLY